MVNEEKNSPKPPSLGMDQHRLPRSRAVGGRSRGRPQQQQQQQPVVTQQILPQPSQQAQPTPPAPQGASGNRGRGTRPVYHVEDITQQIGAMGLRGPGASGDARGVGDTGGRGGIRQRSLEESTTVYRRADLETKMGTKGEPITLQTNYFRLSSKADLVLYQYRVDFNPDIDVTVIRKALLKPHKNRFGQGYIFDGTVLHTKERFKELELVSERLQDGSKVQIKIKHTTDLAPGDPHYVQLLNNILRKCMHMMDLQLVGRNYFDANAKIELKQFNIEIWPGYITSIRQHEDEVLLGVEISSKVMRLETAYAFLQEAKRESANWKEIFLNGIVGTTVITRFNNRTYRIDDVDFSGSPSSTFELKDKTKITYRDYYKDKYQIDIRYNDQPLLVSAPREKDIRGGRNKNLGLIPEMCCLTGLTDRMRANRSLMTAMADYTKIDPNKRVRMIEDGFMRRLLRERQAVREELQKWNVSFEPALVKLSGRVLHPGDITVGNDGKVPIDRRTGDFSRGLVSCRKPLFDCDPLLSWAVVFTRKMSDREILAFYETLKKSASTFHFQIGKPHLEAINDDKGNTYAAAIETGINNRVSLVMCIVPNDRKERYDAIKRKCYIQRAIPNQVVLMKNVSKNSMSVATKIAIQMSCKIGGSPWTVRIPFSGSTMIVGFDVCHDTMYQKKAYGALVVTLNNSYSRYASFVNAHEKNNELSNFMGTNMLKAVTLFKKHNEGAVPERIIFYRDGVGEGNLDFARDVEVASICTSLQQFYGHKDKVPLSFIVVSKRINTRIFAKGGNPPPGTVIDSCITRPTDYDFFLVSQSVARGTVAPTSYNVIYDALKLKPDVVQNLSYRLCHLYYNWSGALRVPAPCQYAHKLAFLVGQHLHAPPSEEMNSFLYFL